MAGPDWTGRPPVTASGTHEQGKIMNKVEELPAAACTSLPAVAAKRVPIPQLVGEVYESGAPAERCRLLEHLMSPLGALSLALIANGIFADLRFRNGWQQLHVRIEDVQKVCADDVAALADHVQQVSAASVEALGQMLAAWPVMSGSAAAAALMSGLMRRNPRTCFLDRDDGEVAATPT